MRRPNHALTRWSPALLTACLLSSCVFLSVAVGAADRGPGNYAPEGAGWQLWASPATLAKERPNVLLIHGFSLQRLLGTIPLYWQAYISFWTGWAPPLHPARCDNRFGQLPALLSAEGYNVWQFEYEDGDGNTAARFRPMPTT